MARTGGNPVSAASLEYEYWYGVSADLPNRTTLRRGGGPTRWHSLVSCNHGDSSSSRFGLT
jgi:hypothetical protein